MPHYVGLDASKATTNICIVNEAGERVREGVVETEPRAIIGFLRGEGRRYRRVGVESISFTPWIYEHLAKAGLPVVCIESRQARSVMKEMRLNKNDRNDARGIAEIMRAGIYKAVHIKTRASQEIKLVLTSRLHIVRAKRSIENQIRGFLVQFGLKLEAGRRRTFEARAGALLKGQGIVAEVVRRSLAVRQMLVGELRALDATVVRLAEQDPVCQRLMTAPGIGPLTALVYRSAVDLPERFTNSRTVGVHFGLTKASKKSGRVDPNGRISRIGDKTVRSALVMSAQGILRSSARPTQLRDWGLQVRAARGGGKAVVAVARRLAVILHRMWVSETDFHDLAISA